MTSIQYNILILDNNNLKLELDNIIIKYISELNNNHSKNDIKGIISTKLEFLRRIIIDELHEDIICSVYGKNNIYLKDVLYNDNIVIDDKLYFLSKYYNISDSTKSFFSRVGLFSKTKKKPSSTNPFNNNDNISDSTKSFSSGGGWFTRSKPPPTNPMENHRNFNPKTGFLQNSTNSSQSNSTNPSQSFVHISSSEDSTKKNSNVPGYNFIMRFKDITTKKVQNKAINLDKKILNSYKIHNNFKQQNKNINKGSQIKISKNKQYQGYLSFKGLLKEFNEKSVLSQINQDSTNFGINNIDQIALIKNNLRELLLNLYIFIYGFELIGNNKSNILNHIKKHLIIISNSSKEFIKLYDDKYNTNKFIFNVIRDIIISCIRISVYYVAQSIMNNEKPTDKKTLFLTIDILSIIFTNFSHTLFTNLDYNILIYNNSGKNIINSNNDKDLLKIKDLLNFCVLKILNILLSINYKNNISIIINYIFSYLIYSISNKYGYILFSIYIKISNYIDTYKIKSDDFLQLFVEKANKNNIFKTIYNINK